MVLVASEAGTMTCASTGPVADKVNTQLEEEAIEKRVRLQNKRSVKNKFYKAAFDKNRRI